MEGASGARVQHVVTRDGTSAYLKVSRGDDRELRFYREDAADLPIRTPALLDSRRDGDVLTLLLEDAGRIREPPAWSEPDWAALGRVLARLHGPGSEPLVRVHGDCHTGNVLFREGEEPALCDWQSTGLGRPEADLAFVRVRCAPYGVEVPATLLETYLAERPGDAGALRRAVDLEELDVLVHQWPEYAGWNTDEANERVRRRVEVLRSATDAGSA